MTCESLRLPSLAEMNSHGGRGGSDRSLAVKAHDHALAAIQFAKGESGVVQFDNADPERAEHRYREAAEMHLTSGTYFKKLQTLLKQENEIDTATSLGLLVHHHMFMQEEMNKQAEQFEKLPEKQQQQRRSSVGLDDNSKQAQEVEKAAQEGNDAAVVNPSQHKGHQNKGKGLSVQQNSLEQ